MKRHNKHTLIIDGNYFLFRTLYVMPRSKSNELLSKESDVNSFMLKLATDFSYQVRLFDGLIDKIVWTVDSRSWRKDFYPDADYKGNRKSDTAINWDAFSKVSDDFMSILTKSGVIIAKVNGAEGDDLMYAWCTESLSNNKSVILMSGDRDIVQLVNKAQNGSYSILFSPANKKLYTFQGFSEWVNTDSISFSNDIFDVLKNSIANDAQTKQLMLSLIKKKKITVEEVNAEDFRFIKVLTGDSGDNVPSAYWYTLNNRRYGISDNKAQTIISEFKKKYGELSHIYLYNDEFIQELANIVIRVMNAKHMSREQIITNIRNNTNLMILSTDSIPDGILDEMFSFIETKSNHKALNIGNLTTMKSLLEGSSYNTKNDIISISPKIFKDSDDDSTDFSFIKDRKGNKNIF